jgi:hypothetical protein
MILEPKVGKLFATFRPKFLKKIQELRIKKQDNACSFSALDS